MSSVKGYQTRDWRLRKRSFTGRWPPPA